ILAISDEAGNKLEQRHYDAWGSLVALSFGNDGAVITDKNIIDNSALLIDRGYTSHEHFAEVGIIHMNGRLYDPLLRRFLNADENIQNPMNTQNYNKYGYVMNNPLMYNDPSGEFLAWLFGAMVGSYFSGVQANHGNWNPLKWDWKNTWTSVVGGAFAGAALGQGISN
ncbi:RHS repeat domain-containing protein, partial [Chryseobacterium rhizosphaerae]